MEGVSTTSGTKYLVGKNVWQAGLIAAFIATHISAVAGLWFGAVRLPNFDFNTINGLLAFNAFFGAAGAFTTPPHLLFIVGGAIHYINGILWGIIFALLIHRLMGRVIPGMRALTPLNNMVKGLLWGWALWLISSSVWMPLVVGVNLGIPVGPFLTGFGTVGFEAVFTNLLWHTIYGLNLGLIFSPRGGSR